MVRGAAQRLYRHRPWIYQGVDCVDARVSEPWSRFVGMAEGGKFQSVDKGRLRQVMQGLEGKRVEMAIRSEDPGRNLSQNSYIHVLAKLIERESGESMDRVKRLAVLHALGVEAGTEREEILGREFVIVRRTSSLRKEEASKVIDWLRDKCSFLGIAPPRPDQVEVIA